MSLTDDPMMLNCMYTVQEHTNNSNRLTDCDIVNSTNYRYMYLSKRIPLLSSP